MRWMIRVGLGELAVGGMLGWAMLTQAIKPEWIAKIGMKHPNSIRQTHLDYVFMGLILCAVGTVAPSAPKWIAIPLVFGTIMNPLLFLPPAFEFGFTKHKWYMLVNLLSFIGTSGGLVAVAVLGPG